MTRHFKKHYTLREARALIPAVQGWLEEMRKTRKSIEDYERWAQAQFEEGRDIGGARTNDWLRRMGQFRELAEELEAREIQVKSLDQGLVDFPSIRNGLEIFLCWEMGEEDIRYWHELTAGYAGRKAL